MARFNSAMMTPPLVPGMCMSVITSAGAADVSAASPALPSAALRTP